MNYKSPSRTLYLHIGLPKTATTFWQREVFPRMSNILYLYKGMGDAERQSCLDLKKFMRRCQPDQAASLLPAQPATGKPFQKWLKQNRIQFLSPLVTGQTDILLSDEGMSIGGPRLIWEDRGITPEAFSRQLSRLSQGLASHGFAVKILLGIRRQDQWLCSRYAESCKVCPEMFGQEDFESRMDRLIKSEMFSGAMQWLDYGKTVEILSSVIGQSGLILLPLERLAEGGVQIVQDVQSFLGVNNPSLASSLQHISQARPRNKLSLGENEWKLKNAEQGILLSADLQASLLKRFEESNCKLAQATGFDEYYAAARSACN